MKQGNLKINAVLNTIKTILGIIFPIITFPYVSRVLEVENIGVYQFSSSVLSYFILLANLGVSTYAVREITKYRDDPVRFRGIASELFSINLLSTAISYILLILCLFFVPKFQDYQTSILILSAEMIFTLLGVSWIFTIYEDYLYITVRSIVFQILSLVLMFTLVHSRNDLYVYLLIVVFANAGSNIINFIYARKKYCKLGIVFNKNQLKHIKPILIIFFNTIAISIYVNADSTMLGFYYDNTQVGLYGTAVRIYTLLKQVLVAMMTVLIPRFSLLLNKGETEKKQANILINKVFTTMCIMVVPASLGLFLISEDVIHLIAGESYLGASVPLQVLTLAVFLALFSYLCTQCILIPKKQERIVLIASISSALLNIVLNFYFIPQYGIVGAAITTVIAEIVVLTVSLTNANKIITLNIFNNNMFQIIIACIPILLSCYLVKTFVNIYIVRVVLCVLCSSILYFLTLIMLKNPIVYPEYKKVLARIKRNQLED